MALFKIYKGLESELPKTYHKGYAYFATDRGNLYIDIDSSADFTTGTRVQVNAGVAIALDNGTTHIEIDDIVLKKDIISVAKGGTGLSSLTVNAVLVGNGTNAVKMIPTANGAFYATGANAAPQFGILPKEQGGTGNASGEASSAVKLKTSRNIQTNLSNTVSAAFDGSQNIEPGIKGTLGLGNGGTGAANAASARENLDVYSKDDSKKLSPVAYNFTIPASGWTGSGPYTYSYSNTSIKCGLAGNVHPIITPTNDIDKKQWNKVSKAVATARTGVVFTCDNNKPETDLNLTIIDYVS